MDFNTIQNHSSKGRHQSCIQACQKLIQIDPQNPLPWLFAGKSFLALAKFQNAEYYLLQAHHLDKNNPETIKLIGRLILVLSGQDKATSNFKSVLTKDINNVSFINNIAISNRQSGNIKEAIDLFTRVLDIDPQMTSAHVGIAASFLELGDLEEAESFATQALAINRYVLGANEILGMIYQNKSNFLQAIESYRKELAVNPNSSNSLLNCSSLLIQDGQHEAAIQLLSKSTVSIPCEQSTILLARAYQSIGKFREAIFEYQKLDLSQINNKRIPYDFGLCLLRIGDNSNAIRAFQISIKIDGLFLSAWGNLGNALKAEGRFSEAIQATQRVLTLDPNNSTALTNLGGIYQDLGQLDKALNYTLKSLETSPDNATTYMNLGGIYKDLGLFDKALTCAQKSLQLNPDNPTAHMNMGSIYIDLGYPDKALSSTINSLKVNPDNYAAYLNLGGIYKSLGNLDQALRSYLKSLSLNPNNADILIHLSYIYKDLERCDDAIAAANQALKKHKSDSPTTNMILHLYDSLNKEELLEEAITYLKSTISSNSLRISMYEARLLFRKKRYNESWDMLPQLHLAEHELSDWFSKITYHEFRARIAEKNNLFDDAYVSFSESQLDPRYKSINHKNEYLRIGQYITLSKHLAADRVRLGHDSKLPFPPEPVFLIGFPRSGTTLLDSVLRSHPEIEVLEEKDCLRVAENFGINHLQVDISNFNSIKDADLNLIREAYFDRLKFHSIGSNKLIIDKLPLHTTAIPFIK